MKIVICDPAEVMNMDLGGFYKFIPEDIEVVEYVYEGDKEELVEVLTDVDGVITSYVPFDRYVLEKCKNLKIISVWATGFDSIDLKAAEELGVRVTSVREYCTFEVAEHTLLLMLSLMRSFTQYVDSVQRGNVWNYDLGFRVNRLNGLCLGIFGLGKIGSAVAQRAKAFGLDILAYDPYIPEDHAKNLGVKLVDMDEILANSDIITVHMNLTSDNESFFNMETFKMMKKKPYLINVARGGVIDEEDLVKALDLGLVSGAALDVLTSESPDLKKHSLVGRENVVLTPHMAFYSEDSVLEAQRIGARAVIDCFQDKLLADKEVNLVV